MGNKELDPVAVAEIKETLKVKLDLQNLDNDSEVLLTQIIEIIVVMYLNRTVKGDNLH